MWEQLMSCCWPADAAGREHSIRCHCHSARATWQAIFCAPSCLPAAVSRGPAQGLLQKEHLALHPLLLPLLAGRCVIG